MAARIKPIEHVVKIIGGVRKTARAIGRSASNISQWRAAAAGAGEIPRLAQKDILRYARLKGLDITAEDLILGRLHNKKPKRR